MKKTLSIFLVLFLLVPNLILAQENIFYLYLNDYGFQSFKKNYRKIDILAPQFYTLDYDLKIKDLTKQQKEVLRYAKKKRVDVMPLIVNANFNKNLMSTFLRNGNAKQDLWDFMIKEARKKDFIGWQFDFENINHFDRDLYTEFVAETYKKMKEKNLQFSVAVVVRSTPYNPNSTNQDWSSAYDYQKLAENSDFLSLMTYDDPNSHGPVASIPYVNSSLNYLRDLVPQEKMSLGVPMYCWKWQSNPKQKVRSYTHEGSKDAYKKFGGISRFYFDYYGAEQFKFKEAGLDFEIWCEGAKGLEEKLNIVKDYNLRGISAWALGQEDKNIWKLLK